MQPDWHSPLIQTSFSPHWELSLQFSLQTRLLLHQREAFIAKIRNTSCNELPVTILIWIAMFGQTTTQHTFSIDTCVSSSAIRITITLLIANLMINMAILTLWAILVWFTRLYTGALMALETIFTMRIFYATRCAMSFNTFFIIIAICISLTFRRT